MGKYSQTMVRIGAGLSALGSLAWLLWPNVWSAIANPEALLSLIGSLAFWIAAEIKTSEEFQTRAASPNDLRLSRMLLQYHAEQFRVILKDQDFHSSFEPRLLTELSYFLNEFDANHLHFQNKSLEAPLSAFQLALERFVVAASKNTVPYKFPSGYRTSVRPPEKMDDFEISDWHKREIDELNNLATDAWKALDQLKSQITKLVPEAFDVPFEIQWLSPDRSERRVGETQEF